MPGNFNPGKMIGQTNYNDQGTVSGNAEVDTLDISTFQAQLFEMIAKLSSSRYFKINLVEKGCLILVRSN